jgi:hypothetical protein
LYLSLPVCVCKCILPCAFRLGTLHVTATSLPRFDFTAKPHSTSESVFLLPCTSRSLDSLLKFFPVWTASWPPNLILPRLVLSLSSLLPILPFTSTTSTFDSSVGAILALLYLISFPLFLGLPRYYLHISLFLLKPRTCSSLYHVYRMREGDCYIVMPCRL